MRKQQKGFTLIELLVVISIIGILTAIGIASFTRAQRKARDARRLADLEAIEDALQLYYADNNQYPNLGTWNSFDTGDVNSGTAIYIKQAPLDPQSNLGYWWRMESIRQCYCLSALLELGLPTGWTNPCTPYTGDNYAQSCP